MYTSFITDARKAISDCWNSVENIHEQQAQNAARLQPDYAEAENKKLSEQQKAACAEAKKKITAIMDKATEDAAALDVISPLTLDTPADQRVLTLLNGQFDLSVEQLQHVVDEYVGKTDYTLLNAVGVYCQNHGMKLNRATAESRRSGIAEVKASALGLVSRIENANYKNGKADLSLPLTVSEFCTNSDFASELCGRLGQDFSGTLLSPVVELENGGFNFNFRGVRDDKKAG